METNLTGDFTLSELRNPLIYKLYAGQKSQSTLKNWSMHGRVNFLSAELGEGEISGAVYVECIIMPYIKLFV